MFEIAAEDGERRGGGQSTGIKSYGCGVNKEKSVNEIRHERQRKLTWEILKEHLRNGSGSRRPCIMIGFVVEAGDTTV